MKSVSESTDKVVRILREDWENLLRDNQELVERCEQLFSRLVHLQEENNSLRIKIEEVEEARMLPQQRPYHISQPSRMQKQPSMPCVCMNCGRQISESDRFCDRCGYQVSW